MYGTTRANKKEKELDLQEYMNKKMKEFEKKKLEREDKEPVQNFIYKLPINRPVAAQCYLIEINVYQL